jgi:cobalt/nickel transport system permease protein
MKLSKAEKTILSLSIMLAVFLTPGTANAMHIMEGYLPLGYSVAWSAVCIPVLVMGVIRLKKIVTENKAGNNRTNS